MKTIIKRPPGDAFAFRLFYELTNNVPIANDSFYIWSIIFEPTYSEIVHLTNENINKFELDFRNSILDNIKQDLIIIGIKDHLTYGKYNFEKQCVNSSIDNLSMLFDLYPDKKFIILTSLENLEQCIKRDNLFIVPWGGDITNQELEYKAMSPVLEKNLDSTSTYLSLNRGMRLHRALSVFLQHGLKTAEHGLVSAMFKDEFHEAEVLEGKQLFSSEQNLIYNLVATGYYNFKNSSILLTESPDIYPTQGNDNVSNFKNKLAIHYRNTFVELVSETSYFEKCFLLTEKTLNSIYGCSFPILLSSKGTVDFLRNMGMDTFDDIVDHTYDQIDDPIERMYSAIKNNIVLLTDNQRTKELWSNNRARFEKNINFAKSEMYIFYKNRAKYQFNNIIKDLSD
jgi:hypothetical protein